MPIIIVKTTLLEKDIPKDFDIKLCEKVAETLNKPIERITLTVQTGQRMMRAGSTASMVCVDIHSIGVFDQDRNPTYSPPLLEFLKETFNLPMDRLVLVYYDLPAYMVAALPQ